MRNVETYRQNIRFFAIAHTDECVELLVMNATEDQAWQIARNAMDNNTAVYAVKVAPMSAFKRGAFEKLARIEQARLADTNTGGNDD